MDEFNEFMRFVRALREMHPESLDLIISIADGSVKKSEVPEDYVLDHYSTFVDELRQFLLSLSKTRRLDSFTKQLKVEFSTTEKELERRWQ